MSVEIAIFNHFDILGTKEMLFPPSGGLDSIKAAPSVNNNTLLGGCFFSPSPLERVTAPKGCLQEGSCTADCLTPALFFCSVCRMPAPENQFHLLLFEEGVPVLVSHCSSQHCAMAVAILSLPLLLYWGALPVLVAGTGEHWSGCHTAFEQLLSLCVSITFALLTGFPLCLGKLTDTFWVHRVSSTPNLLVTKEADPSPFW